MRRVGTVVANNLQVVVCLTAGITAAIAVAAPFAGADPRVISGNDNSLSAEITDTDREQKLDIKKLPANPNDDPVPGAKPYGGVQGLTFRLSKVQGIDVTTERGRQEAKTFTVVRARQEGFSDTREETTTEDGLARFHHLSPGLYLIEEFAPDDDHNWLLSSPRLVILPLGDVMGRHFSYENLLVTKPDSGEIPSTSPKTPSEKPSTPHGMPHDPKAPADAPGMTGKPSDAGDKDHVHSHGMLAVTGAGVIWVFAAGLILIVIGLLLMRRRKQFEVDQT